MNIISRFFTLGLVMVSVGFEIPSVCFGSQASDKAAIQAAIIAKDKAEAGHNSSASEAYDTPNFQAIDAYGHVFIHSKAEQLAAAKASETRTTGYSGHTTINSITVSGDTATVNAIKQGTLTWSGASGPQTLVFKNTLKQTWVKTPGGKWLESVARIVTSSTQVIKH